MFSPRSNFWTTYALVSWLTPSGPTLGSMALNRRMVEARSRGLIGLAILVGALFVDTAAHPVAHALMMWFGVVVTLWNGLWLLSGLRQRRIERLIQENGP